MPKKPDVLDKGLPAAEDVERFVLGSILLGHVPLTEIPLQPEDFSLESHRRIWARMNDLAGRGEKVDRITLANELMSQGQIDSIGGFSYLVSLDEGLPELANLDAYVRIVQEKSRLRQLIFAGQRQIDRALMGDTAAAEIATEAAEKLQQIQASNETDDGGRTPIQIIENFTGGISAFLDVSKRPRGLPTGFARFDELTGGMKPGEVIIIGARPSHGKTSWALNVMQHLCLDPHQRRHVAFFSLEMSESSLLLRMACAHGRVDSFKLRGGYLNAEERHRLQVALNDLLESRMTFYDEPGLTMPAIAKRIRRLADKEGLHLAIIDYLGLIASHGKIENRNQEVTIISRNLKILAKQVGIPLIVLSQLSRLSDRRTEPKPQLSDLRDSGCLAGDSLVTVATTGVRIPIRDLAGVENFRVWSRNGDVSETAMCTKAFTSLFKQLWQVKTATGKSIRATANHRFMTPIGWRRLDELAVGEELCTYLPIPEPLRPASTPANELFLLGHLLGNGCLLPRHSAQYTTRHADLAEAVAASALELFGSELKPRIEFSNPRGQGGWFQVYFSSQRKHTHGVHSALTEWAKDLGFFGLRSAVKVIPAKVFGCSNESLGIFLGALWETDGTFGTRMQDGKEVRHSFYSTSSPVMAEQVQYLLARLGIPSTVALVKQGKHKPNFHIRVTGGADGLRDFFRQLTFTGRHHLAVREIMRVSLESVAGASTTTYAAERGVLTESIVSIEPDSIEECFDMTVPITNNMEVSCFVTHNSIEQDADVVAFIFREEMHKRERADLRGIAELIVAKQRDGPIGNVPLRFLNQYTKFEDRADLVEPEGQ